METIITSLKDASKPRTVPLNVYADKYGYTLCLNEMQSPIPLWNASLIWSRGRSGETIIAQGGGRRREDATQNLCNALNTQIEHGHPSDFVIVKYPGDRFLYSRNDLFWIIIFRLCTYSLAFLFFVIMISKIIFYIKSP